MRAFYLQRYDFGVFLSYFIIFPSSFFLLKSLSNVWLSSQVYDHKIFRYFENPLESLSVIKDDEHIVAYRLNQRQKGSGKAKLEILHGGQER